MMTEEEALNQAEGLAYSMGITFYVVRSREGHFLPVQRTSQDHEIVATCTPPGGVVSYRKDESWQSSGAAQPGGADRG